MDALSSEPELRLPVNHSQGCRAAGQARRHFALAEVDAAGADLNDLEALNHMPDLASLSSAAGTKWRDELIPEIRWDRFSNSGVPYSRFHTTGRMSGKAKGFGCRPVVTIRVRSEGRRPRALQEETRGPRWTVAVYGDLTGRRLGMETRSRA
jgi:hypothetical protein